jgi:LysR family carnitine catabolism transcriptional activator
MNFKLRQVAGFVAAARLGSFSAAARELAMTQPAFSQLIRELETTLGVRLFERTTRRMELTEAGQRFLAMVERPLDDLRDAAVFIRELADGRRGRIVFALLPSVAFGFALHVLARFKVRYPDITVRLIEDQNLNLVEKVLNREVDFAIGTLAGGHRELSFRELFVDELLAVFPRHHRWSGKRRLTWPELAREPLVLLPRQSSVREIVNGAFARSGLSGEPAYEVANMVTAMGMARAGMAVTVMPGIALAELNMNGLHSVHLSSPSPVRRIGIISRLDRPLSPAAATYVEMLFSDPQRTAYNIPNRKQAKD